MPDDAVIRYCYANTLPLVGRPFVLAVAERVSDQVLIAEGFVFWGVQQGGQSTMAAQRFNYIGDILRLEVLGQAAVTLESAARDAVEWAKGQIDSAILEAHEQHEGQWPVPQWELRDGEARDVLGLWLRGIGSEHLQAIKRQTETTKLREFLDQVTRIPPFTT